MYLSRIIFAVLIIFLLVPEGNAQLSRHDKKLNSRNVSKFHSRSAGGKFRPYQYVGIGINALNYYGDLAPVDRAASTDISFTRPGFGIMYAYRATPSLSFRADFNYGRIKGDDNAVDVESDPDARNAQRYYRNLSFRNDIKEITIGFNYYIFPDHNGPSFRSPINFYFSSGVGIFSHDPKGRVPLADYQSESQEPLAQAGEWVSLRDLGTEGQHLGVDTIGGFSVPKPYSKWNLNIPIIIGGLLKIPDTPLNIQLELGVRLTFTDYLDDVGGRYIGLEHFSRPEDQLARIMSDRAAEPTSSFDGTTPRNVAQERVGPVVFSDGVTRNISTYLGSGFDGSIRGGVDNDIYFITKIKLVYVMAGSGGGKIRPPKAKFR